MICLAVMDRIGSACADEMPLAERRKFEPQSLKSRASNFCTASQTGRRRIQNWGCNADRAQTEKLPDWRAERMQTDQGLADFQRRPDADRIKLRTAAQTERRQI